MSLQTSADAVLERFTQAGDIPGVVAMAADRGGVIYEGVSGTRTAGDEDSPMTLDAFCWFASMTKAVTGVAAMQLVEQGKLDLDAPAAKVCPELDRTQVREGWNADGSPRLRAPARAITVRHLLTHTAGFAYEIWDADTARELESTGKPGIISAEPATLDRALVCDPGSAWNYGISIDWAGRVVEQISGLRLGDYLRKNLFAPLGIRDITFTPNAEQNSRAASLHARLPDGSLAAMPFELPNPPLLDMGGHGLMGSIPDYLRFLRAILRGGELEGTRILEAETVSAMAENHIGDIGIPFVKSHSPAFSNDFDPGPDCKWGLSFLINTKATPEGRSAGSLSWAGLANSYYWIDPVAGVTGVLLTQILPFFDAKAVALFRAFETAVYSATAHARSH